MNHCKANRNCFKCAICFDEVQMQTIADATAFKTKLSRPVAVLACGHCFHLDCIGNSFNAKRAMECPCCRDTQEGEWHTPKTPRHNSNSADNDSENSQPVDLFVSIQRAVLFRELLNLRRSNIDDVNASYWNPAGLIGVENSQISKRIFKL